jgi:5'-nucleotidase
MLVLITNDDGVHAPGLGVLARAVAGAGYDIVVAAPLDDRSGSGAAIGPVHLGEGLAVEAVSLEGLTGVPCYGLDGPPALAVMTARLGAGGAAPHNVVWGFKPGADPRR